MHSLLLRDDGEAVALGCNGDSECDVPLRPPGARYVDASVEKGHSILVRDDGAAVSCGLDVTTLGLDEFPERDGVERPMPLLPEGSRYVAAAAGVWHGIRLRDDGVAVAFGTNSAGECDVPTSPAGTRYVTASLACDTLTLLRGGGIPFSFVMMANQCHACVRTAWRVHR